MTEECWFDLCTSLVLHPYCLFALLWTALAFNITSTLHLVRVAQSHGHLHISIRSLVFLISLRIPVQCFVISLPLLPTGVKFCFFFQTQYIATVGIQTFVPSRQQTTDPCLIVGNELISVPWECTFSVSKSFVMSANAFNKETLSLTKTTKKYHRHLKIEISA